MSLKTTFMCLVVEASKHAVTLVVARPVEMLLDSASEFAPNKEVTRSFERHSPLTLTSSHVHAEASHQYVPQASQVALRHHPSGGKPEPLLTPRLERWSTAMLDSW